MHVCAYRCAGSGWYLVSKYIQNLVIAQFCVCMCVHVHVYVDAYFHVYMLCMRVYMCASVWVCTCIYVYAYVYVCTCMCVCMCAYFCVCMCIHVCANVHGCVHVHVYMCMYVDLPAQYTINITYSRFFFNTLLINFKIILLFCWHVQHQSLIDLPTVIIGNSLIQ